VLLLVVAVAVPAACVLWFMTEAMRNEQLAVQGRLTVVYQAQLDALEQSTGIDFTKDLVAHLGRHVVRFRLPIEKAAGRDQLSTYMIELADPAPLRATLAALLRYGSQVAGAYQLEPGKIRDYPAWILRSGRPGSAYEGRPFFYLCVAEDWLICSARPEGIEQVARRLREPGLPSLEQSNPFKKVMDNLPPKRNWEGYIDIGALFHLIVTGRLDLSGERRPSKRPVLFNTGASIDPALWGRYFGPAGIAAVHDREYLKYALFVLYASPGNGEPR